jgi:hypothetical protein
MAVGTGLWTAAALVLVITGTRFDSDNAWWLWTCLAGIVMGVMGMVYTRRRAAVYRAAANAGRQPESG